MAKINSWGSDDPAEETKGGTGKNTYATGDILYSDASNSLEKLTIGSTDEVLKVTGGIPAWTALPIAGGSDWTHIVTQATTTGTSYEITTGLGTAYDEYMIVWNGVSVSSAAQVDMGFSVDGGSTYTTTYWAIQNYSFNTTILPVTSTSLIVSARSPVYGFLSFSLNKKAYPKPFNAYSYGSRTFGTSGVIDTASDIDAFKVSTSGTAFDGGEFIVYGR